MSRPDVCISLISTNTASLLKACLESIYNAPPCCSIETWVVDNASSDETAAMLRDHFPSVRTIHNNVREGYGANHNKVFERADARYFLILNEDTVLQPDTIDTMTQFMDTTPDAGASGCRVLFGDGRLQHSVGRFPMLFGEFIYFGGNILKGLRRGYERYKYLEDWNYEQCRVVDWISGCFLFVRGDLLRRVGGFHKDIFIYFEDAEWCYRMKTLTGYNAYFVPRTQILHFHGQTFDPRKFNREYLAFQGSCIFLRSSYGRTVEMAYRAACRMMWYVYYACVSILHLLTIGRSDRIKTKKEFYHYFLFEGK